MENGYYKVLNVDKHSSLEEVKRQYKILALLHHPDRETGNVDAFKKVNEAYEYICNKINQDKENDDIVDNILKQHECISKLNIEEEIWPAEVLLDIGDVLFGCSRSFVIKRTLDCEACSGTGIYNPEINTIQCRECKGKGTHPRMDFLSCTSCNGKGRFIMNNKMCKGLCHSGKVYQESQCVVGIDFDAKHESRIKVSHTDVIVKHKYHHHYDGYTLKLDGYTVIAKVPISILELLCGFTRRIKLNDSYFYKIQSDHAFDTHKEITQTINEKFKLTVRFKVLFNKDEEHLYEKLGRSMRAVLKLKSSFDTTKDVSSTTLPYHKVINVHKYHRDNEEEQNNQ